MNAKPNFDATNKFNQFFDDTSNDSNFSGGLNRDLNKVHSRTFAVKGTMQKIKTLLSYFILIGAVGLGVAYFKMPEKIQEASTAEEITQITTVLAKNTFWKDSDINLFLFHWGNLSEKEKAKLKRTKIFEQFGIGLSEQIALNKTSNAITAASGNSHNELLQTVAIVTKLSTSLKSRTNRTQPNKTPTNKTPTNKTKAPKLQQNRQIARAEAKPKQSTNTSTTRRETTSVSQRINNKDAILKKNKSSDFKKTNSSNKVAVLNPSVKSQEKLFKVKTNRKTPLLKNTEQPTKPLAVKQNVAFVKKSRSTKSLSAPTAAELESVIDQYIDAYEKGNISKIITLFSINIKTSTETNRTDLRERLTNIFNTTSDRQLFIRNMKWTYKGDIVKGIGSMERLLVPEDENGVLSTNGKVQIIAKKLNKNILITHMYSTQDNDD